MLQNPSRTTLPDAGGVGHRYVCMPEKQQMPPPIREESNEQNNNNSNQQKPRNFEATGQHGNLQSQRRKNNLDDSDEFDDADIDDLLA